MAQLGTPELPLRAAIIGSGPSGFYAAEALVKSELTVVADMFDRLPTPYGLVRHGVAPDHQKVKNVIKIYERVAAKPEVSFYGNVEIGTQLTIEMLREYYDAVIFCSGTAVDRHLGVPGEDLTGSYSATEFVAWYNGHPDFKDRQFDLSSDTAVVIGQGNVAVDVCRILAKTPEELEHTDIAEYALDTLTQSKIETIYMIGRRGPVQAKFTEVEMRELGTLESSKPKIDPEQLKLDPLSELELNDPDNKHAPHIFSILKDYADPEECNDSKGLHIRFFRSPKALTGEKHVESIVLEKNRLEGEPFNLRAFGTEELEEIPCGVVFRSVGFRGSPIPGVPFNEELGRIENLDGRIMDGDSPCAGLYTAGWIKRGPSGIIGTNRPDSKATVNKLLEDVSKLIPCPKRATSELIEYLSQKGARIITYEDWEKVNEEEIRKGHDLGKPREKFSSVEAILNFLDKKAP
jgi:ferredoxin--NADP+ reductase